MAALALAVLLLSSASASGFGFPSPSDQEGVPTAPAVANTHAPAVTGTPTRGAALTCSTGAWSGNPSSFQYAWTRDGAPIPGAGASSYTVQAADEGHSLGCVVTARNAGGEYVLRGVPSGAYEVAFHPAESDNLLPQYFSGRSSSPGTPVGVTLGATTTAINASLAAGGQMTGRVTSAFKGTAVSGASVCAKGAVSGSYTCAATNANGEYMISGLASDSYVVTFSDNDQKANYAPQFYAGAAQETESTRVAVTTGLVTPGINAALTPGGQITGTVTGEGAGPLAGAEVCAGSSYPRPCTTTDAAGRYTINNLVAGKYTVVFIPLAQESRNLGSQEEIHPPVQSPFIEAVYPTEVSVPSGGPIGSINAELKRGGSLEGVTSAKEGGARIRNVFVCAAESEEASRSYCTISSSSGEYKIEGVPPGSYTVIFFPVAVGSGLFGIGNTPYAAQRYKQAELPEPATPVEVKQNVTTGGINAELSSGAQIDGRVTAPSGAPIAGVTVCGFAHTFVPACATTDATGGYAIHGLASGSYQVEFIPGDPQYVTETYNGHFASKAPTLLAVTRGVTYPGIDATLPIGGRITGVVTSAATGAPVSEASVCAYGTVEEEHVQGCTESEKPGPPASAAAAPVLVPAAPSVLRITRVQVNARTGAVTFTLTSRSPGMLSWSLVFRNADVGFADTLAAQSHCRRGLIRHAGRCVHATVPFGRGSRSVRATTLQVTVHPDPKALRALRAGRTLHVSGRFTLAAPGVTAGSSVSVVVHLRRRGR